MPDTHLILHVKGTEAQTTVLSRVEVQAAVSEGKITESQLIWRPEENMWKQVKELPELIPVEQLILHIKGTHSETKQVPKPTVRKAISKGEITYSQLIWRPEINEWKPVRELPDLHPVEQMILHVKGTEAETKQMPKPAVRKAISKGEISHSQLIWRPQDYAWKQVRELPELLPTQRIAPAPKAKPVVQAFAPEEGIIPESPTGPVDRATAASEQKPQVRVAGTPQPRVVASGEAAPTPQPRIASAQATAPQPRIVAAEDSTPMPRVVAVDAATPVPQVRVAVGPAAEAAPVVQPRIATVSPETAQPRIVASESPAPIPQVRVAAVPTEEAVPVPQPVAVAVAVPAETPQPRIVAVEQPTPTPQIEVAAAPVEQAPLVHAIAPVAVSETPQPRIVAAEAPSPTPHQPVETSAPQPRVVAVETIAPAAHVEPAPMPSATPQAKVAVAQTPQPKVGAPPRVIPFSAEATPASTPTPKIMPKVQAQAEPVAVAVAKPQPQAAPVKVAAAVPKPQATPAAAPVAATRPAQTPASPGMKVKIDEGHPVFKWICIVLGVIVAVVGGVNYLLVDRPLQSGMSQTEYANVSVYGHLGAFVQYNVIVIHIPKSEAITKDNFTDILAALAQSTPVNPITHDQFERVALTSGWTAQYSFSGYSWKELGDMAKQSKQDRQDYVIGELDDGVGNPLRPESTLDAAAQDAKAQSVWDEFVDSFSTAK